MLFLIIPQIGDLFATKRTSATQRCQLRREISYFELLYNCCTTTCATSSTILSLFYQNYCCKNRKSK